HVLFRTSVQIVDVENDAVDAGKQLVFLVCRAVLPGGRGLLSGIARFRNNFTAVRLLALDGDFVEPLLVLLPLGGNFVEPLPVLLPFLSDVFQFIALFLAFPQNSLFIELLFILSPRGFILLEFLFLILPLGLLFVEPFFLILEFLSLLALLLLFLQAIL